MFENVLGAQRPRGSPGGCAMGSQQQFVGTPVQIKTTIGEDIQGELFCYDVRGDALLGGFF